MKENSMIYRPAPEVRLYRNPWPVTVPNGVLLQILTTAANHLDDELAELVKSGQAERHLYAAVILDPTRQRPCTTVTDRPMAGVILGGEGAERFLSNALAKADAHDRHNVPNGWLLEHANYTIADGEFTYGNSASLPEDEVLAFSTIAAGSGLSVLQDEEMARKLLQEVMPRIGTRRSQWLREQRAAGHGRWFSDADMPAKQYQAILTLDYFRVEN